MSPVRLLFASSPLLAALIVACGTREPVLQPQEAFPPELVESVETSVLQPQPGYRGDALGAEVVGVSEDEELQVIELSIPIDPELVDQVTVTEPDGRPLATKRPIEISADPENNKVGITIPLSKKRNLGFRVQLIDLPDDQ